MERGPEEHALTERFDTLYGLSQSHVLQAVTDDVCGCGYIGTSWTTRAEADLVLSLLGLGPHSTLLELGSGAGWPGLYLTRESGCRVTLLDLPEAAIRLARERAVADGMGDRVLAMVGDAANLPFTRASFSAISHSDLLCCLLPKAEVLAACRDVVEPNGRMVFTVISVPQEIGGDERQEALSAAPSFTDCDRGYRDMLAGAGWEVERVIDITPDFLTSCQTMLRSQECRNADLVAILGEEEVAQRGQMLAGKISAIGKGHLIRELYCATPC